MGNPRLPLLSFSLFKFVHSLEERRPFVKNWYVQCVSVINKSATITTGFYRRDLSVDPTEYHLNVNNFGYAVRVEYDY